MSPAASKGGGGTTSSIWTPANVVTCVRVVAVPLWLLVAEFSHGLCVVSRRFSLLCGALSHR